jgi:para-nitrobenzyl esterase
MKDLESMGEKFFAKLGVNKEADPLKAARALPPAKILEAEAGLSKDLKTTEDLWDSAIDDNFLTDLPARIFREGKQHPVPVITSANLGELMGPGMILMPFIIPDYVNILNGAKKAGQKGFACIFDQVPSRWRHEGCVSFHALELGYVFGDWDGSTNWWSMAWFLAKASGAKTPDPGLTEADRKVSETMMAMWAQFARTGDPHVTGLTAWPAYEAAADHYLYIAEPPQIKQGFSKVAQKTP